MADGGIAVDSAVARRVLPSMLRQYVQTPVRVVGQVVSVRALRRLSLLCVHLHDTRRRCAAKQPHC
jgi:hypothetical protein